MKIRRQIGLRAVEKKESDRRVCACVCVRLEETDLVG